MRIIIISFFALAFSVCLQAQIRITGFEYLKGKWVKEGDEKDTLNFTSEDTFILSLQHGSKPPRDPEGPYSYKFTKNGIVIRWTFASTVDPNKKPDYYSMNEKHDRLTLGKFYKSEDKEDRIIFIKLQ